MGGLAREATRVRGRVGEEVEKSRRWKVGRGGIRRRTVGMEDLGLEFHLWRLEGVARWEGEKGAEETLCRPQSVSRRRRFAQSGGAIGLSPL